jgi:predicted amidophosphoribosyltransferase
MSIIATELIDAAPFIAWLDRLADRLRSDQRYWLVPPGGVEARPPDAFKLIAERFALTDSWLRKGAFRNDDQVERDHVEVLVDAWREESGETFADVYPNLVDDADGREAFCGVCHEVVTVSADGICPWCEHLADDERPPDRKFCPGCDRMVWPTTDGHCWRCRSVVGQMPWSPCKCGCGELVHRFDRWGRRIQWVRGHAPRTRERSAPIEAAPFAAWLAEEVKRVDPIAALVTRTNLTREEIIDLIEGRTTEFDRERIRRALWLMSRAGGGTGAQPDRNIPQFFDLYPEAERAKVCPGCGKGKAPHAVLCKRCRTKADRENGKRLGSAVTRLGDALIVEAYETYASTGHSIKSLAVTFFDRAPHTSVESLAQVLSREFKRRGWAVPPERQELAA